MRNEELDNAQEISVVVPVHNEEKRIWSCLVRLSAFLERSHPSSEIVVSEDGSSDQSVQIIEDFARRRDAATVPIVLLHSPDRLGKGSGLWRGLQAAGGKYVIFIDVDLPVPLTSISTAVNLLKSDADIVVASRFTRGSSRNDPVLRRIMSLGFHALVRILFGLSLDSQCGLKAARATVARRAFVGMGSRGFAYDIEFLVRARQLGASIVELSVQWQSNRDSSLRFPRDLIEMSNELLRILPRTRLRRLSAEAAV